LQHDIINVNVVFFVSHKGILHTILFAYFTTNRRIQMRFSGRILHCLCSKNDYCLLL